MSKSENWSRIDVARSRSRRKRKDSRTTRRGRRRGARAPHRAARAPSPGGSLHDHLTHLDPELPGRQGADAEFAIGPLELVPGGRECLTWMSFRSFGADLTGSGAMSTHRRAHADNRRCAPPVRSARGEDAELAALGVGKDGPARSPGSMLGSAPTARRLVTSALWSSTKWVRRPGTAAWPSWVR